jgi:hypothetical protein
LIEYALRIKGVTVIGSSPIADIALQDINKKPISMESTVSQENNTTYVNERSESLSSKLL